MQRVVSKAITVLTILYKMMWENWY